VLEESIPSFPPEVLDHQWMTTQELVAGGCYR